MFDASLITFFPRPDDGVAASVDEIAGAVGDWYAGHPDYRKNGEKLLGLMRKDGWLGWRAEGPQLLSHCPFYRLGYFPARTHGWDATMTEYDRKSEVFEYGYQVGHRALFSLRPGESFVREAGNRGLHVNGDLGWNGLKAGVPENDLAYVPEFDPGYRGGVVGNGTHSYAPALKAGDLERGAEVLENLESRPDGVKVKDRNKPGVIVVEMKSPYVYLGGEMQCAWNIPPDADGRVSVSISTDGGRSFAPTAIGSSRSTIVAGGKLDRWIARRYAYQIKVELTGAAALAHLVLLNDIQHAPRTLPRLEKGKNTITVAAGHDPTLATKTITGRIAAEPGFTKNETAEAMGVTFENLKLEHNACWWKGGTGVMTVPIDVPGDLVGLGFSAMIRARGEKDRVAAKVSHDGGKTWREVAVMAGPTQGRTHHVRVDHWPAGVRKALLRFELTGNNTIGVQSFRVDADYRDPLTAKAFRPIRVVHRWKEGSEARSRAEVITRLPTSYVIEAGDDPEMLSVTCAIPAGN
jgi:hypothetical protein